MSLLGSPVNTGNLPTTSVDYATKYALKTLLTADGLLARIVAVVMFAAAFAVQQQGTPSVPVTMAPPTRCCPLDGILVPRRPHPVKVLPRSASMGARRLQYRRGGEETGARPAHAWADKHYRNLEAPPEQEEFFELNAIHVRAA